MTDSSRVASYLAELEAALKRGDAREHTHRPAIHHLLEASGERITATNEPAREGGNAPDFVISRGMVPIGHVETKDVGETLNKVLKTEQLKRYREALPNLLLTDYLEFIWLVDGEERARIVLAEWDGKKIIARANAAEEWAQLIGAFLNHQAETLRTPTQLAQKLAAQTRLLKEAVLKILQADWDFHIGGYRVLEKWLKDRKRRTLSTDDIVHYQRIVGSVRATRGLMRQIDEAIGEWPLQ